MPRGIAEFAQQPWPRAGWEYTDLNIAYSGDWAEALNELGQKGWMVVSIIHDEDPESKDAEARVLLVRPRKPSPKKAPPAAATAAKPEPEDDDGE